MKIVCKSYSLVLLTYQPTTLGFTKILEFILIWLLLWCTIVKDMAYSPFAIVISNGTFPKVSPTTQIEIVCKTYASWKLMHQFTTLGSDKTIGISCSRDIFKVFHIWRHAVGSFHYCVPQWDLSNVLSSYPNIDSMQMLQALEVDVQNYHFGLNKTIIISYYRVIFMVHCTLKYGINTFYYCAPR